MTFFFHVEHTRYLFLQVYIYSNKNIKKKAIKNIKNKRLIEFISQLHQSLVHYH
jgi:hypothetical protein